LQHCPLCLSQQHLAEYYVDKNRAYLRCASCGLVSVDDSYLLSAGDEKTQYDYHQNDPDNDGYRQFLSRTFAPLLKELTKLKQQTKFSSSAEGLDFGCGSGPTLSVMAEEAGISISNYDLYYFNFPELLNRQYDFVTMTEVIEHIADADKLLKQLDSLLKPNAILAVMTKRLIDREHFKKWHYKNDPTHIRFYSIETFQWIAEKLNWRLEIIDQDVVFFYKNI